MMTFYVYNQDRRNIINNFIYELYNDYVNKKISREITLNCTLLEISFKGIVTVNALTDIIKDRDIDMIEFKGTKKQERIDILVHEIHKIEYSIEDKSLVITTDDNVYNIIL